jgi:hypothetical protein
MMRDRIAYPTRSQAIDKGEAGKRQDRHGDIRRAEEIRMRIWTAATVISEGGGPSLAAGNRSLPDHQGRR